jgi:hypothetical protein
VPPELTNCAEFTPGLLEQKPGTTNGMFVYFAGLCAPTFGAAIAKATVIAKQTVVTLDFIRISSIMATNTINSTISSCQPASLS